MGLKDLVARIRTLPRARVHRLAGWSGGVLLALVALGYFAGPPLIRSQLESRLTTLLGRPVTVGAASFNPFTLEARVSGFALTDPGHDKPLLSFDELYVDASIASLKAFAPVVAAVRLTKPALSVIRLDGTRYNFSDLLDRFATSEQTSEPPKESPKGSGPRFAVGNIELIDGRIDFDDRPIQVRHEVTGLQLGVPFVSNFPAHIETKVLPSFAANINGDPFVVTGESTPFKDSHDTAVKLSLKDVDLPRYLEYVPLGLDFKLPSAKLETDLRVNFSQRNDGSADVLVDGSASLAGVELVDKSGAPLVAFDTLTVAVKQFDLLANKLAIERVELAAPKVRLHRTADGRVNLERLVPRSPRAAPDAPSQSGSVLQFELGTLKLSGGAVEFIDDGNARPYRAQLTELEAELNGLSFGTNPGGDTPPARYVVSFKGEKSLTARSEGTFSLAPLAASGSVNLDKIAISEFAPYYEAALAADIADGTADVAANYRFSASGGALEFRVSKGAVALQSLRLMHKGGEVGRAGKLAVEGLELDLSKQSIDIATVTASELRANIKRAADGTVNLTDLVRTDSPKAADSKPSPAAPSWRYAIGRVALDRAGVRLTDESVKPTAVTVVEPIQLTLGNISSAKNTKTNVTLRTGVNKGGKVALNGSLVLDPFAADLTVDIGAFDVVPFEPYFAPHVNVSVTSGAINTKGRVTVALPTGAPPQVRFEGDVSVANLDATDKNIAEELLKWRALDVTRLNFALEPFNVDIGEIALSDFFARVVITPQGRLNLQSILAASATGEETGAAASSPNDPQQSEQKSATGGTPAAANPATASNAARPQLKIGKITLNNGNVNFSDFFIKPNYSANLTNLAGGVTEITPDSAGDVDVRGRVNNTGALEILGKLNPLAANLYLDLKAAARDIDLPALTPYSTKYVGYGIQKGKLSVKIAYKIADDKLTGENSIYLDQLTFGEKVESPDALNIPVMLAVALLKDRHGVIDINLPISGTLSDPEFSIGGIVVRVIVNLLVKAVTSPFSLLASAFGGSGGEELSYAEFAAGRAELNEPTEARLKTLAKALEDRPGLTLEVAGRIAPDEDREGLRRVKLEQQLKAQKFKELARNGTPVASIDKAVYAPAEYQRLLAEAYRAASFSKPRTAAGLVRDDLPAAEMEKLILQHAQVSDDDLRALASQRAQFAKDHLVERGGIAAERIFIVAPKLDAGDVKDQGKPTRVEFSLR